MIAIKITTNIPYVVGKVAKFPNQLEKSAEDISSGWALWVEDMAKDKAPVWTGTLRKSIKARQQGPKTWVVGIYGKAFRYGRYVERGQYSKKHPTLPIEFIEQHLSNPGRKGVPTSQLGEGEARGWFRAGPSKKKGFLKKALALSRQKVDPIISTSLNKNVKL